MVRNISDRKISLRESIRDKKRDAHGLTIVEVMVAFVLVLLAIAMLTTATMMATKIQKKTQDGQNRSTELAEAAYRKLEPEYNPDKQCWELTGIRPSDLESVSGEVELRFSDRSGAVSSEAAFTLPVKTADLVVSTASDASIQARYHIYR